MLVLAAMALVTGTGGAFAAWLLLHLIELVDFMPIAEVEQRFQTLQQMMAQQQAPAEGEGGASAPAQPQ